MHDAFLKLVFADRRMVEILIRGHAPEWAAKIDFSTLHAGPDFQPGDPLPEFVYLVLYHGDGPWTAVPRGEAPESSSSARIIFGSSDVVRAGLGIERESWMNACQP